MYGSSYLIDWLTATRPIPPQTASVTALADRLSTALWQAPTRGECDPWPRNYTLALAMPYGRLSWHPEHPQMGICLNLTGRDLEASRQTMSDETLEMLLDASVWRFTRIDLSLDYDGPADVMDVRRAWEAGTLTTSAKQVTIYEEVQDRRRETAPVGTVYVGSAASDRRLRCYNKAAEQGLSDQLRTRIEYIARHGRAEQANEMLRCETLPVVTRALINDFISCDVGWWGAALTGPLSTCPRYLLNGRTESAG